MILNITYMGFSAVMLNKLLKSELFCVKNVITQDDKVTEEFAAIANASRIPVFKISCKHELEQIESQLEQYVILYEFGIIIPGTILQERTVVNFHAGDLNTNRGRHPISWSILNCEHEAVFSVYRISSKIDLGELICQSKVPLFDNDSFSDVKIRLESTLPLLLDETYQFFCGRKETLCVAEGKYNPKIEEKDYTIDVCIDSLRIICRKINSQKGFKGAVLNYDGSKVYITDYKIFDDKFYLIDNLGNFYTYNCAARIFERRDLIKIEETDKVYV